MILMKIPVKNVLIKTLTCSHCSEYMATSDISIHIKKT